MVARRIYNLVRRGFFFFFVSYMAKSLLNHVREFHANTACGAKFVQNIPKLFFRTQQNEKYNNNTIFKFNVTFFFGSN